MKRFSLFMVLCVLFITLKAQESNYYTVYFDFDRYGLTPQTEEALTNLATELNGLPEYHIEVQAHTDDRGTNDYNNQLARQRAKVVETYLADQGIQVAKISIETYGESRPAYANDNEESRQLNRRVDLLVKSWRYDSVDDLFGRLSDNGRQEFTIDPNQDIRLIGQQGTSVWIPAGSFLLPNGSRPEGTVNIVLEEAYAMSDMLLKGLHTTAGDRLLETGGMIFLGATVNGQALQLNEGAALSIGLPTDQTLDGMELFNGTLDAQGNLSDWEAAGQSFSTDLAALKMPPAPYMNYPAYFELEFELDKSGEPQLPKAPAKPFEPHEPRRESFKYNPGFVQSLFTSKEKKKSIEETLYQDAVTDYQERKARYENDMIAYKADMEAYKQELNAYEAAYEQWLASLEMQKENWRESTLFQAVEKKNQEKYDVERMAYQEKLEKWRAKREELLAEFESKYENQGNLDATSVNNYFFEVNQLGWINCDRFYDVPEAEKMALAIQDLDEGSERIFVIFEELNAIVSTYRGKDQQYLTRGLPRDARVKVIGIKVEDGRPQLAVHDLIVADTADKALELHFESCKLSDIRNALASL